MLLPNGNPRRLGQLKKLFSLMRKKVESTARKNAEIGFPGGDLKAYDNFINKEVKVVRNSYRPGQNNLSRLYLMRKSRENLKPPKPVIEFERNVGEWPPYEVFPKEIDRYSERRFTKPDIGDLEHNRNMYKLRLKGKTKRMKLKGHRWVDAR